MSARPAQGLAERGFGRARLAEMPELFPDFMFSRDLSVGVEELDLEKRNPLLRLNDRDSLADAVSDLGPPAEIGGVLRGLQESLYGRPAIA